MDTQHRAKPPWVVIFLLGLGVFLGLLGSGYSQEGSPKSEAGAAAVVEAKRLEAEINKLYGEGKYAAALPLAQQVVALWEQALGATHPDVAQGLNNLARLYYAQGQYAQAEPLLRRALTMREQALGSSHPNVATSLNNLAELYRTQGQYAQAEPLYRRALTIWEQALGSSHPNVATSLNNLALLYHAQGQYAQAEPLLRRALTIREQALGLTHPNVAASLNNLAELYRTQGQYAQAEPLLRRALTIREQALGPSHPDVAQGLNNLALLYYAQGQYAQAEPLYQRALTMREQALGPSHPDVAQGLNNLALLYSAQGQYTQAEPLYQRALTMREQALGPSHPAVATSLNNLAGLYRTQGQYAQAEPLLRRALTIWERALGPSHPDVAQGLNSLAVLYYAQGQYAQAEPLYQRALTIREQALGPSHPNVAVSLNNLALLYSAQGQYAQAEPLYQRALTIREQALGPSHPNVATSLNNLARLYYAQGQYTQAESLLRRALTILEQALGPSHPNVATNLNNLARLFHAKGDYTHVVQLRTRSSEIREHTLALMLTLGTEAQKLASAVTLGNETNAIVSLHTTFAPHEPQALRLALTTVLRRKGRVLDAMADTLTVLRRHVQPEDQLLLAQWAATRGHLATLVFQGLGTQSPEHYRAQLTQLETQTQQLEAQLSARSAAFRTQMQPVTLEQVQAAIPEGAALVELAVYTPFTPPQQWGAERYVAYILHRHGPLTWVELGEAVPIDQAAAQLRIALSGPHHGRVKAMARALDELVMRPIRPLLGGVRHLLLAPDGALHLVPFGALVDETQHYLLERFTISYLTTGRDLVRPLSPRPASQPPLIAGNPDYEATETLSEVQVASAPPASVARRSAESRAFRFTPLPGTAEEVSAVHRLLPASQLLTAGSASEAALKQVQGPLLLHLATHGFFLVDQPLPPSPVRALLIGSVEGPTQPPAPSPPLENPLLRAGLALAGANAPQPEQEDGILTALEVAGLDLWGTALVVLSACETGVGQVRNGEGVYGLRRALVMAGAESQVMSLWQVADDATRDLMIAYYQRLLAGEGRAEALRQVQLAMLASPQQGHPFYWAAFMLSGAWTPLPARR